MLVSVVPAAESANSSPHTERDMEWERWAQWAQEAEAGESTQLWTRRSDCASSKPSGPEGAKVSPEGDQGDGVRDS